MMAVWGTLEEHKAARPFSKCPQTPNLEPWLCFVPFYHLSLPSLSPQLEFTVKCSVAVTPETAKRLLTRAKLFPSREEKGARFWAKDQREKICCPFGNFHFAFSHKATSATFQLTNLLGAPARITFFRSF